MNTVHFTHGDPQETKVFLHRHFEIALTLICLPELSIYEAELL